MEATYRGRGATAAALAAMLVAALIAATGTSAATQSPTSARSVLAFRSDSAARAEIRPVVERVRADLDRRARISYRYVNAALVALFRYRELLEQAACVMGKLQVQLDEQPAYAATAALQSYSRLGLPAGLDQRLDLLVINAELAAQARQNDQTYAMTVDSYCHLVGL